jgi:16S rRNA (cytosine1402-N4)-methyltransferase
MRMNTTRGESLSEWLKRASEREIARILLEYGDERNSQKIARRLVDMRGKPTFPTNSLELADLISSTFPPAERYKGMHPATRSFQAMRILINDELGELEKLISDVFPKTSTGGRLAILSFHSLEDRKVKEAFKNKDLFELPFKKPIEANEEEIGQNPRSRSAKLRFAIRR